MQELRIRRLEPLGNLRLTVIERVDLRAMRSGSAGYCVASMAPVAIVICGGRELRALDVEGLPVEIDELRLEYPELSTVIGEGATT
jgi:hypothetical protein